MLKNNFLEQDVFEKVKNIIISDKLPWYAQAGLANNNDGQVLFTHILVDEHQQIISRAYEQIGKPLLNKIKEIEPDFFRVLRMKINCYPNQTKVIKSDFHIDLPRAKHKSLIFNINNNNGCTEFKNPKIKPFSSIENSAFIFNGKEEHRSVSQTDTPYRWNINFNYEC